MKQVLWNPHSQVFASLDDKNLCLFDSAGGLKGTINFFEETQTHLISCFLHAQKYQVYVLISSDFKMLVYSEVLELIHKAEMSRTGSRVLAAYFLESRSVLILVGISAVRILDFAVIPKEGNSLEPDMTSKTVVVEQRHVLTIPTPIEWIRKSYFQPESELLVLWDQASVCLQCIVDENAKIKYENIVRSTTLMEVLLIPQLKTFVAGMLSGEVYVFGYTEPKPDPFRPVEEKRNARIKSMSPAKRPDASQQGPRPSSSLPRRSDTVQFIQPAHIYSGHIKAVVALSQISATPHLFLSGSLDGTMCLWSLKVRTRQKFTQLYSFKVMQSSGLSTVSFIDERQVYCTLGNQLFVGSLRILAQCFATFTAKVRALCRVDKLVGVLGEDDGTVLLDESGEVASIVYPLPTFVNVKQILYSADLQRIFWLLHSGSLCRIRREKERGVLEKVVKVGDIKVVTMQDTEGRALLVPINCMKLAIHQPPRYDFEATKAFGQDLSAFQHLSHPHLFFILSVGRGLVMFVPVERPEIIYTKISVNRETVTAMEELESPKLLLLLSELNNFLACSYDSPTLEPLLSFTLTEPVTCLQPVEEDAVFVAYQNGETQVWRWKQRSFFKVAENKSQVHSGPVVRAVRVHQLLVTTAGTEFVKFWSLSNTFLKEVRFPAPITDLLYCADLDCLLISHGNVVSRLSSQSFPSPADAETDDWLQAVPEVDVSELTLQPAFVQETSLVSLRLESRQRKIDIDGDSELLDVLKVYDELKEKKVTSRSSLGKKKRKARKKLPKLENSSPAAKLRDQEQRQAEQQFRKEYLESLTTSVQPFLGAKADAGPVFLTRRQLTEERIVSNVLRYGDPADRPDVSGLRVVAEEGALRRLREEL